MIELERHIEILLLWNDCVIVPGFGGFTASHVPARFDEADNTFVPPLRTLGFNPKLNVNDSLLVQSYTETYDISYPEALKRVTEQADELRQHIQNEGSYTLNDIGTLYLTESGGIGFIPCEAGVLTPELYSLGSFEMTRLAGSPNASGQGAYHEATQEHAVATVDVDTVPQDTGTPETDATDGEEEERTISIKLSALRNMAAVLIAVAGFFMLSAPVNNSKSAMQVSQMECGIVSKLLPDNGKKAAEAAEAKPNTMQPTARAAAESPKTSAAETVADEAESSYFCIVLASRVTHKNAERFAARLVADGYKSARVLCEKNRAVKVVYGNFKTLTAAYNALKGFCGDESFQDAWVYNVT